MKFQLTNPRCFNTSSFSFPLSFRASSSRRSNSAASVMASRASIPVTAIIRRMPLAIPDSSVITNSLISPVFATCLKGAILSASKGIREQKTTHVPPQNSTLVSIHFGSSRARSSSLYLRVTTRTGSGYVSPNTARRPGILRAAGRVRSCPYTGTSSLIHWRQISSMRCISLPAPSHLTGDLYEKSKRSLVGATSDPLWSSPLSIAGSSTVRRAWLRMCVAVWFERSGRRRSWS